jgi:acetyl esterase/lipase
MNIAGLKPALLLLAAVSFLAAAEPVPIHLWPHRAPGEDGSIGPEKDTTKPTDHAVGGRPVIRLGDVSDPTITVYRAPHAAAERPAVLVFPGGGYNILAMDLEGTEICEWLNAQGITAVLLKYRVPRRKGLAPYEAPLQDAQRAISLVRSRASEWNISADHIGVLGFSAGGNLAVLASTRFAQRAYANVDAADTVSCRPDFAVLIYPAYLTNPEPGTTLASEVTVSQQTPPTFIVQTEDDPVHVENSLTYYLGLKNAHVPAEMHLFSQGRHGYGMRRTGAPVNRWPGELKAWLGCDMKLIPAACAVKQ